MSEERITLFVKVILPIPLPKLYTYRVPHEWEDLIRIGLRVAVPFGSKKVYSGIIYELSELPPEGYQASYIIDILDEKPIVSTAQISFWEWMSAYYLCFLGDVLATALPAGFRVQSLTKISLHPDFDPDELTELDPKENEILSMLLTSKSITVEQVQASLKIKSVLKYIKSMYVKGLISMEEELRENYKPKFIEIVECSNFWDNEYEANLALNTLERQSEKQFQAMMMVLGSPQRKSDVKKITASKVVSKPILKALEKKGYLKIVKQREDRFQAIQGEGEDVAFTPSQEIAVAAIQFAFENHKHVLLHGVTGSGKTHVYLHFAAESLKKGKQVLFLVPEVALTEHLVSRVAQLISEEIGVWHHYYSTSERTELYEKVRLREINFIIGTRNALFAPFAELDLIIIDEEHESSYKQFEKRPMFHARDASFQLAKIHGAKLLMGSATPSYEMLQLSNDNTIVRVNLFERFEQQQFAELMMLNLSELKKQNRMQGFFSDHAIDEIKLKVKNRDKIIVYHNRKGYAPFIQCSLCGHTTQCVQCDIALTFYKSSNQQRCNYCGYQQNIPKSCLACGGNELLLKGVGTEKIVEELNILFPELRIARFDQQSIKKRSDFQKILNAFDSGEIDILVGTQLLAKGIDFEDVALIVVPDADVMLNIPDFRSHERAFQQLYQLSGRAGRGKKRGLVVVQSYQPTHLVLEAVKTERYLELAESELAERKIFGYPPFTRLIEISLKHKDQQTVFSAAAYFNNIIRTRLSDRLLGPLTPSVAKVKNMYIQHFLLKMDRQKDNIPKIKEYLLWAQNQLQTAEGFSGVRIDFDVDPN